MLRKKFGKNLNICSIHIYKLLKKFYFSYPCPRKLREIVKMSLMEREQPEQIKEIWKNYYKEKQQAFGVDMLPEEMNTIIQNGKGNPFFIFPVRKSTGHFNLVVQAQDKSFIYTFLEDYKRNPDNSTPYLVITIFDELVFKKGISLVRGDIIGDLSKNDAEVVFNMTRHYFTNQSDYRKVITFNRESSKFAYQEHIDECLRYYL